MTTQRRTAAPPPELAQLLAGNNGQPGANLGQYVTAALLAAVEGGCECETCQLMRRASKAMRAGLLAEP